MKREEAIGLLKKYNKEELQKLVFAEEHKNNS